MDLRLPWRDDPWKTTKSTLSFLLPPLISLAFHSTWHKNRHVCQVDLRFSDDSSEASSEASLSGLSDIVCALGIGHR